jgi:hypothetical protein
MDVTKITPITQDTPRYSSLDVDMDERLYGLGSKKYRVYAASSSADPVIKVESTWDDSDPPEPNWDKSAIVENLVIDGANQGVTGITLENVYHCMIRNVTIKNCEVGILMHNKDGLWTECNCLKHIRMMNVKTGIKFSTDGPRQPSGEPFGDSFAFTTIDDVGISLANDSSAVGIQIGEDNNYRVKPYSSRIKANIWMGSAGGTGLKIINLGELKYGLINLAVHGQSSGTGIKLEGAAANKATGIWDNQFTTYDQGKVDIAGFWLSTTGVITPIDPAPEDPDDPETDVENKNY